VSWDRLFKLDSNLAQDETVGALQSGSKLLAEFTDQDLAKKGQSNSEMLVSELLPKLEALCPWTNSVH
jgi:hypothetical protein